MTLLPIECPRVNGCKSSSSKSEKDPASAIRNDARPNLGASAPLSLRSMAMRCRLWECGLCCARPAPSRRPDTRSFAVGAEAPPAPEPDATPA